MRFGIFSNGQRQSPITAAATYEDDLWEIVLADELGYEEAWVSEHHGAALGNALPDADLLICKAAAQTRQIRMGPAVRIIPISHPIAVARQAAVCDQLLDGRYMIAFGAGGPPTPYETYGVDPADKYSMMDEGIDLILRTWAADEPFDHLGTHWSAKNVAVQPKIVQQPHIPIGLATDTPHFIEMAARRGFTLLVGHYDDAALVRKKGSMFTEAAGAAGLPATTSRMTVARQIYVSESVKDAYAEVRADMERHIEFFKRLKFPIALHLPASGKVEDVTFDHLCDSGFFIVGDPDSVTERLQEFERDTGGFGKLLLVVGKDWGTRDNRQKSMRLFIDEVAPRLASLGPEPDPVERSAFSTQQNGMTNDATKETSPSR